MHPNSRYSPASVLLALRDPRITDWTSLCRAFGLDPRSDSTPHSILGHSVRVLADAGLIQTEREGKNPPDHFSISISPHWAKIQGALNLSLTQLAESSRSGSMVVHPSLGLPETASSPDIFVLMPFTAALRPIYDDHIKIVAHNLHLTVARADDFFTTNSVITDVWSAICGAKLLIADCTGRNPNVFYEIGLAHVLGKTVILLTQSGDDVPFDVRHIRYIQYEYTPRGMKSFESTLSATIKMALQRPGEPPVENA